MKKILIFILCLAVELALVSAAFGIFGVEYGGGKGDDREPAFTGPSTDEVGDDDGAFEGAYGKYAMTTAFNKSSSFVVSGNFYYLTSDTGYTYYFVEYDVSSDYFDLTVYNEVDTGFGQILFRDVYYSFDCMSWTPFSGTVRFESEYVDKIYVSIYSELNVEDPAALYDNIAMMVDQQGTSKDFCCIERY